MIPVAVVAGEAGDFESEHGAGAAQADLGDEALKAEAADGRGTGRPLRSARATRSMATGAARGRSTSRFSGPGLALLAPAVARDR